MTTDFDFQTVSITLPHRLEEYRDGLIPEILGIHQWEVGAGDRSKVVRFRHEHAHFSSFLASGLADLYSAFSDYALAVLYFAIRERMRNESGDVLRLPLLVGGSGDDLRADTAAALRRAWRQVMGLRAVFFGFPTKAVPAELVDSRHQDDFWETHFDLRVSPIVKRFYGLLDRIRPGLESQAGQEALPAVERDGLVNRLSARSVMEAYAMGIELLNLHFRKIETNFTEYSEPKGRDPGSMYTVAIEHLLHTATRSPRTTVPEFLEGVAPPTAYYLVTAMSFAAMQVPVVQELEGETRFAGGFESLSPGHRFQTMVDALARGKIDQLPSGVRGEERSMISWLQSCHDVVDDHESLPMCQAAYDVYEADLSLASKPAHERSLVELAWAARANFIAAPNEYVLDAGLFAERFPCQVRYARTSDAHMVIQGPVEEFQARYVADHTETILEGAVFAEQWDSVWDKLPEVPFDDRAAAIVNSIAWAALQFGDLEPGWRPPSVELRM